MEREAALRRTAQRVHGTFPLKGPPADGFRPSVTAIQPLRTTALAWLCLDFAAERVSREIGRGPLSLTFAAESSPTLL